MRRKITAVFVCGAAAALLLASCSKEAPQTGGFGDGEGTLRISAVAMPQIGECSKTRAEAEQFPLTAFMGNEAAKFTEEWAMDNLRTRVVCIDVANADAVAFDSANEYNYEETPLSPVAANYSVTMGSLASNRKRLPGYTTPTGDSISAEEAPRHRYENPDDKLVPEVAEGEGIDFIYFEGWNTVELQSEDETPVEVTVKVANAVVTVEFTNAFRHFFANGATVTLKTKNGLTTQIAGYTAGSEPVQRYIWVRPQQFTLSAVATPQSPSPGYIEAEQIKFDDYVRADADVAPQTLYRCVFDVSNAGGLDGSINVTVDDTPVYTVDLGTVETNPGDDKYVQE